MNNIQLTGIIVQADGGFSGYFAEFPEAVAEGTTQEELISNLMEALTSIIDFRREEAQSAIESKSVHTQAITLQMTA